MLFVRCSMSQLSQKNYAVNSANYFPLVQMKGCYIVVEILPLIISYATSASDISQISIQRANDCCFLVHFKRINNFNLHKQSALSHRKD